jgi:nitrogen-specific signal transduction histidine kinase/CheY-like chemotaxis protein
MNTTLEQRIEAALHERRKAELALHQAQKMEALGQLTAGVAHDFNNILTVVIGQLDRLARSLTGAEQQAAATALRSAMRAADLTHRLLSFGRRQMLRPKSTNVNQLVDHIAELLRRTLGEAIAIHVVRAVDAGSCFVDPTELEAALLNLAINARDAMPSGGALTFQTEKVHVDVVDITRRGGLLPGEYVVIAVSDTGAGIPKEQQEKVFEPFFTTKAVGEGSGLGLAQVYGFAKQSGGHATLYSEIGVGTTVRLYLPCHSPEVVEPSVDMRPPEMPGARAQEMVLVVEDDANVCAFSAEALRDFGYRVLEAGDAAAALRIIEVHPELDLLFTDVGLPGMSGRALADVAIARRPALKVLYTTGYAGDALGADGSIDPGASVLQKPFIRDDLAVRVRAALDGHAAT